MKESDKQKRLVADATDEMLKDKFIQQVGQKARVERGDIISESVQELKRKYLIALAEEIPKRGLSTKDLRYLGSLSVHVYVSDILGVVEYVNVNNMEKMDPAIADGACREMNQKVKDYWGKRQKLRSGF